jgi:hypothetical protein
MHGLAWELIKRPKININESSLHINYYLPGNLDLEKRSGQFWLDHVSKP